MEPGYSKLSNGRLRLAVMIVSMEPGYLNLTVIRSTRLAWQSFFLMEVLVNIIRYLILDLEQELLSTLVRRH